MEVVHATRKRSLLRRGARGGRAEINRGRTGEEKRGGGDVCDIGITRPPTLALSLTGTAISPGSFAEKGKRGREGAGKGRGN